MKVAVVFNTHALGGAERSMICQLEQMKSWEIECFIPSSPVGSKSAVKDTLEQKFRTHTLSLPKSFSKLSRSGSRGVFSLSLAGLSLTCGLLLSSRLRFNEYDVVYTNGLKVMILVLFHSILAADKKCYVFHFRDYLESSVVSFVIQKLCTLSRHDFILVANSESVGIGLRKKMPALSESVRVVYNIATIEALKVKETDSNEVQPVTQIALASMMAPWKGVHWALTSLALSRFELQELGIKTINVYGGEIYQTVGEHRGYFAECKAIVSKLGADDFISFRGMCPPEEIFSENDVLIHSSISPEPFGRVVLEAFHHRVALISTGLGGSGELIEAQENAMKVYPYDTLGLLSALRKISQGVSFRGKLLNNGYRYSDMLNRKSIKQVENLISECEKRKQGLVANRT